MAGGELNDVLQQLRGLVDAAPARAEPIKLIRVQLEQLRAAFPTRPNPDPAAWFFGTPIVLVDSTTESTPYIEGWIRCPSCGEPANDHGRVLCDKVMVFGPFGDFAVRPPRGFFDPTLFGRAYAAMTDFELSRRRLLRDPGVCLGDMRQVEAALFAVTATDDGEMESAIARWEDDGGSWR